MNDTICQVEQDYKILNIDETLPRKVREIVEKIDDPALRMVMFSHLQLTTMQILNEMFDEEFMKLKW